MAFALLVTNCRHRRRVKLILMMYEMINVIGKKETLPDNLECRKNRTEY